MTTMKGIKVKMPLGILRLGGHIRLVLSLDLFHPWKYEWNSIQHNSICLPVNCTVCLCLTVDCWLNKLGDVAFDDHPLQVFITWSLPDFIYYMHSLFESPQGVNTGKPECEVIVMLMGQVWGILILTLKFQTTEDRKGVKLWDERFFSRSRIGPEWMSWWSMVNKLS